MGNGIKSDKARSITLKMVSPAIANSTISVEEMDRIVKEGNLLETSHLLYRMYSVTFLYIWKRIANKDYTEYDETELKSAYTYCIDQLVLYHQKYEKDLGDYESMQFRKKWEYDKV